MSEQKQEKYTIGIIGALVMKGKAWPIAGRKQVIMLSSVPQAGKSTGGRGWDFTASK